MDNYRCVLCGKGFEDLEHFVPPYDFKTWDNEGNVVYRCCGGWGRIVPIEKYEVEWNKMMNEVYGENK